MKRENRINLWFLAIFMAATLPGIVMLARRRFGSSSPPPLMFPDAISHRLAYMTPPPAPPDAGWFVPPGTQAWVMNLVRQQCEAAAVVFQTDVRGDAVPVISPDRSVQWVWSSEAPAPPQVAVIVWREVEPLDSAAFSATGKGSSGLLIHSTSSQVITTQLVQPVRQELMACGYLRPPKQISLIIFTLPKDSRTDELRELSVRYPGTTASITMPEPATTRH